MIVSNIDIPCINETNKNDFCIYGIKNKITSKYYIGSTTNKSGGIRTRFRRHIYHLLKNTHHSNKLQRAFNKYKKDFNNWEFFIFDTVNKLEQMVKEQIYIDKYNSYYNGYNSTKEVGKIFSGKMSKKHKDAISKSKQTMLEEEIIDIFEKFNKGMSYKEISKYYNVSYVTISTIINNDRYYTEVKERFNLIKTFYNYIFYNMVENKFYRVYNFSSFCREKMLNCKMLMPLYLGKFKKTFIDGWTVFSKENFSLKNLRYRIDLNNKVFVLYKDSKKIEIKNVAYFCREKKLDCSTIYHVINGTIKNYKGYSNENSR